MKELTVEEKAKRYDEAIERAKDLHDNHALDQPFTYKTCEDIFPELKESEEEKIRKELISLVKNYGPQNANPELYKDMLAWLEKQGEQKPADKVEPKVKVGDWIVNNNGEPRVFRVERLEWPDSIISSFLGKQFINTFTLYEQYHLWTIQNAKDGDVLSFDNECSNYHSIGIFKRIASKNEPNGNTYRCYVRYDGSKEELEIPVNGGELHHCGTSAHPATQEQHNLLFAKIKEAGYEWDAEKKELKKIEQEPYDYESVKPQSPTPMSYGKELEKRMREACNRFFAPNTDSNRYSASELFYAGVKAERDLNTPAWSEEDEEMLNDIIRGLTATKHLIFTHDAQGKAQIQGRIDWLKFIKERYAWKPSEEILEALYKAVPDNVKEMSED